MTKDETLHFVNITETEKKLLNIYRKFLSDKDLLTDIEDSTELVVKEMVRHSVEDWAMEETMNAKGSDLCRQPYEIFSDCVDFMYNSGTKESKEILEDISKSWRAEIEKVINGDLVDLPTDAE